MSAGGEEFGQNDCIFRVSLFDLSVENHFDAIEAISKLCGEVERDSLDVSEILRIYSSITFLREWKDFNYEPRTVRFEREVESLQHRRFFDEIKLPQFSSVAVPKKEDAHCGIASPESENSKDFVMHVGGSVWALDWCPRDHERSAGGVKCEFLAVAAHPPNSNYHKIGALLTGRGVVQIWHILNDSKIVEDAAPSLKKPNKKSQSGDANDEKLALIKKPKGRPKKKQVDECCTELKRPRGRPRKQTEDRMNEAYECKRPRRITQKKITDDSFGSSEYHHQHLQALSVEYPEDSAQILAIEGVSSNAPAEIIQKKKGKKQKTCSKALSTSISAIETAGQGKKLRSKPKLGGKCADTIGPSLPAQNEEQSPITNYQTNTDIYEESMVLDCALDYVSGATNSDCCAVPENILLPRLIFCLAHNGKVAWDAKWRPCHASDPKNLHQMGYLAVLLGNGSLEVWDVPLPYVTNALYASSHGEGTDPRFLKLEPVFKCSIANHGDAESIPLTVEWSALCPHDYLLAGCHDGKVALWKFSTNATAGDTRPLLCFSADTIPIRTLAWAPSESDQESANVVLTAGHGGLKFWDIRDPFRPLWELHPVPKFIYSLDWLPDPRCILLSFDDGTIRLLSLVKGAYDAHVNGKPSLGPKQLGMHLITSPSSAIWSVQVSRKTGMVAYCSADGRVCRFQLTTKAVEKDPSRHRAPHVKIWSLSKEASALTVTTSLPDTPLSPKKPLNNSGDSSRTMKSLFESSHIKTANTDKTVASENQPLAICYGNDSSTPGMDETLANVKKQAKGKKMELALVSTEEQNGAQKKESGNKVEVIPPKMVAMHRVRWNGNPGSERWLCSGGSAGIVRCQEIVFSEMDIKLAQKR